MIEEVAVLVHSVRHLDAVGLAEFEILRTVARGDVHESCALLHIDEIRRQQRHVEIITLPAEGMLTERAGQIGATELFHNVMAGDARLPAHVADQRCGHHDLFTDDGETRVVDLGYANPRILDLGRNGECPVPRHGPRGRRPDHDAGA